MRKFVFFTAFILISISKVSFADLVVYGNSGFNENTGDIVLNCDEQDGCNSVSANATNGVNSVVINCEADSSCKSSEITSLARINEIDCSGDESCREANMFFGSLTNPSSIESIMIGFGGKRAGKDVNINAVFGRAISSASFHINAYGSQEALRNSTIDVYDESGIDFLLTCLTTDSCDNVTLIFEAVSAASIICEGFCNDVTTVITEIPSPVPVPAGIWMFLSGFTVLFGVSRKTNRL